MDLKIQKKWLLSTLREQGIRDARVLAALEAVPREEFVPSHLRDCAYDNTPLPIGEGQTISQPFMVAYMTDALRVKEGDRVLEVGTGSGYQAAVLAELGCEVYSVERVGPLASAAQETLRRLGYSVQVRAGDGNEGWPEHAPYNGIMVTAGAGRVPAALLEQLGQGARLVIPVGSAWIQNLLVVTRKDGGYDYETDIGCSFVPLVGPNSY